MVINVTSIPSISVALPIERNGGNQIFPFENYYFCGKIRIMESLIIKCLESMLSGSIGGVVNYLYCLKKNLFKNNHLVRKFFCDLFGGALVAPFIASVFSDTFRIIVAFGVGLCWAKITEVIRIVITKKIEERLEKMG